MDGRVQMPVINHLQNRYGVDYVDVVTEAGPVGLLSQRPESRDARSVFRRVDVSIEAHSSKQIAIVAHYDCAGNPVPDSEQKQQIYSCLEILAKRYPQMELLGLWLDQDWRIHEYMITNKA
jgi:hypothetical protein